MRRRPILHLETTKEDQSSTRGASPYEEHQGHSVRNISHRNAICPRQISTHMRDHQADLPDTARLMAASRRKSTASEGLRDGNRAGLDGGVWIWVVVTMATGLIVEKDPFGKGEGTARLILPIATAVAGLMLATVIFALHVPLYSKAFALADLAWFFVVAGGWRCCSRQTGLEVTGVREATHEWCWWHGGRHRLLRASCTRGTDRGHGDFRVSRRWKIKPGRQAASAHRACFPAGRPGDPRTHR